MQNRPGGGTSRDVQHSVLFVVCIHSFIYTEHMNITIETRKHHGMDRIWYRAKAYFTIKVYRIYTTYVDVWYMQGSMFWKYTYLIKL